MNVMVWIQLFILCKFILGSYELIKNLKVSAVLSAHVWMNWCSITFSVDLSMWMPTFLNSLHGLEVVWITWCSIYRPDIIGNLSFHVQITCFLFYFSWKIFSNLNIHIETIPVVVHSHSSVSSSAKFSFYWLLKFFWSR